MTRQNLGMETVIGRPSAPAMTSRLRAAALKAQAAALEMQEAAAEMLALANEIEDFATRQEDALLRLRGPVKLGDEMKMEAEQMARIVAIAGPSKSPQPL